MSDADEFCRQTRVCGRCGFEETRLLDPIEAAFEHGRMWIWSEPCLKCGSTELGSSTCDTPALSAAQLEVWTKDESIRFFDQDEDIVLARPEFLDLLVEYFDKPSTLDSKRKVLLAALFVMVYDHSGSEGTDSQVIARVTSVLAARRAAIGQLGIGHISDYVLERALPMLGTAVPH